MAFPRNFLPSLLCFLGVLIPLPAATLVHRYSLDTNADDAKGAAHLVAAGNAANVASGGIAGGYYSFDGSGDILENTTNFSLLANYATTEKRPFSLSMWVRAADNDGATQCVFTLNGASDNTGLRNDGFFINSQLLLGSTFMDGAVLRATNTNQYEPDDKPWIKTATDVSNGQWHHLVGVYTAGGQSLYIDGVLAGSSSDAVVPGLAVTRFALGAVRRGAGTGAVIDSYNGGIDEVQVYSGALTATEIATLYANPAQTVPDTEPPPPPATPEVVPVDWSRFTGGLPSGATVAKLRAILLHSNQYALTTWFNEAKNYDAQLAATYLNFGGIDEHKIRHPATEAFALAISLQTGAYDPAVTGVSGSQAREVAVKLARSVAYRHLSNTSGGWGNDWQTAAWAASAGYAAWLLWEDLPAADQTYARRMIEHEANRFNSYTVPYYRTAAGTIISAGDTKSEENAWNAYCLQVAVCMLPDHPNRPLWMAKAVEMMLSTFARPADLADPTPYHGFPLKDWLKGSNSNADGTLVNHSRVHPDYMSSGLNEFSPAIVFPLAGRAVPAAGLMGLEATYRAYLELSFVAGTTPYAGLPAINAPGGTIFIPGSASVYYPHGNDWGTHRRMHYVMSSTNALLLLEDPALRAQAASFQDVHAQMVLDMQARFTDGRTYGAAGEDTYQGREEWVAFYAARSWLMHWLAQQGALVIENGDITEITVEPLTPSVTEGGTAQIRVRRGAPLQFPFSVTLAPSPNPDFTLPAASFTAGTSEITLTLSALADGRPEGTETVTLADANLDLLDAPFDAWRAQHYAAWDLADDAQVGPNADPDGNTLPTLAEYALGTLPGADASPLRGFQATTEVSGQAYATFTYPLPNAGTTATPAVSSELTTWTPNLVPMGTQTIAGRPWATVRDTLPLSEAPTRYFRILFDL